MGRMNRFVYTDKIGDSMKFVYLSRLEQNAKFVYIKLYEIRKPALSTKTDLMRGYDVRKVFI